MISRQIALVGGIALVARVLAPATIAAQEADGTLSSDELAEAVIELDPITVTARKRDEIVYDVPLSITVLEGEELPKNLLDPGEEVARNTPNFNALGLGLPGSNFGTMRGIGPLGSPLNSLDNTIGFAVDGIPTSSFGFAPALLDVERIEVLRGPQGTLFGRNALGGLVSVINRQADGETEFSLSAEYGTENYALFEGIAGGWLIPDRVAGRGVVQFQNFDGDIYNPILDRDEGSAEIQAGRGSLAFTPDDTWTIRLSGGFDFDRRTNPIYLLKEHPDFPVSGVDIPQYGKRDIGYGNATVTKEFDAASFTSVTGYQDIRLDALTDDTDSFLFGAFFQLPPDFFTNPERDWGKTIEDEKILTQEFRLTSTEGQPVSWVAGLSYFRSDYDQDRNQQSDYFATLNGRNYTSILSQTFAAFGDISVPLTDRLTVSGGLRAAYDDQEPDSLYISNGFPGTVPVFAQNRTFDDSYLTGRGALSWNWTGDVLSYASIARGYASGGFERYTINAPFGIVAEPFLPSSVWTYEVGAKAAALGGRLELTGAAFYNDVTDGQLSTFDPVTFLFGFANQDYESYGFELEGKLRLSDRWRVVGGIGVTKSKLVNVDPASGTGAANGNEVPNAPELTANLGGEFRQPVTLFGADGTVMASAEYQYVGSREADIQNSFELPEYHIVNARFGFEQDNREIYVFGLNIFDERPELFGSTFGPNAHSIIVGRGRILGVGASLKW